MYGLLHHLLWHSTTGHVLIRSCLTEQCPESRAAFLPQSWQLEHECQENFALLPLPAGLEPAQVPDHLQAVHVDLKLSQVKTVSFLTYLVRRLPQQVGVVRGRRTGVVSIAHTEKCQGRCRSPFGAPGSTPEKAMQGSLESHQLLRLRVCPDTALAVRSNCQSCCTVSCPP